MSIREILERRIQVCNCDDDGYHIDESDFEQAEKEIKTAIRTELRGAIENKKRECHHTFQGHLIDGRYCDDCIIHNSALDQVLKILDEKMEVRE